MKRLVLGGAVGVACVLTAVVVGQSGRKVSGVIVSQATDRPMTNITVEYHEDGITQTTATDSKGQFEFPSGRLGTVIATAPGFGTAYRRWPPATGSTLRIALASPVVLEGTLVASSTREPLSGLVTALVWHPTSFVSTSGSAQNGVFRLDDLPVGPGVVISNAEGHAPRVTTFESQTGDWLDVHVELPMEARITGSVLDASGKDPVADARLVVEYGSLTGGELLAGLIGGVTTTGLDGKFAINGLVPDNTATVYAKTTDSETNRVSVMVSAGQEHENLVLRIQ